MTYFSNHCHYYCTLLDWNTIYIMHLKLSQNIQILTVRAQLPNLHYMPEKYR